MLDLKEDLKGQKSSYKIIECLFCNEYSSIFSAYNDLNQKVIIKSINKSNSNREDIIRFQRQIEIMLHLDHENVSKAIDVIDDVTFVMEYVKGNNLKKIVEKKSIEQNIILKIMIDIAKGLNYLHSKNIVHRDIKHSNIILNDKAVLVDFGISKNINDISITKDNALVGTVFFIPPEYSKYGLYDIRSDIYSLGITIYNCLTGVFPFEGKNIYHILNLIQEGKFIEPILLADISKGTNHTICKMIDKNPEERFQTPRELIDSILELSSFKNFF